MKKDAEKSPGQRRKLSKPKRSFRKNEDKRRLLVLHPFSDMGYGTLHRGTSISMEIKADPDHFDRFFALTDERGPCRHIDLLNQLKKTEDFNRVILPLNPNLSPESITLVAFPKNRESVVPAEKSADRGLSGVGRILYRYFRRSSASSEIWNVL